MEITPAAAKPPNPFNPGSPVDPNDFVGRVQELENFRQKLRQTINGSLASMAVAGGYGIGKTSFLHKCKTIAEEQNALTIYFSLNEIDYLTRDRLARTLIRRTEEKVREEWILRRIGHEVLKALSHVRISTQSGIEIGISQDSEAAYPNLQSALAAAWEILKGSKTAIVFLIDEARLLERNRAELILYLRAVLEQLQLIHIPVMIVPAGKLTISGPTGSGFSPLVRTFHPVILTNFNREETCAFINKKLSGAGFSIKQDIFDKIYEVTEGHPYVLSAYMAYAYDKLQAGENQLNELHFKAADVDFVTRILSPFFSRFYDQSSKMSKKILEIMSANAKGESSLSHLTQTLKKDNNELSPYLAKLVQDGVIFRIDRGKYGLFHHLLGKYVQEHVKESREMPKIAPEQNQNTS